MCYLDMALNLTSRRFAVLLAMVLSINFFKIDPSMAQANFLAPNVTQLNKSLSAIYRQSLLVQQLYSQIDDKKHSRSSVAKKKLEKLLHLSAETKRTFISAISSSLQANATSLALLREYAFAFNQVNVAQSSLFQSVRTLQRDQADKARIQKTLAAVLVGGQSDMNSELGINREKLVRLVVKIDSDAKVSAFIQREVVLAQQIVHATEGRALADPLASMAITAQMHYLIHSDGSNADMSQPLNWFWGNLKG